MHCSRLYMIGVLLMAAASYIIRIAVFNTYPFVILSGWQKQVSSHLSEPHRVCRRV
ncbi:hypothetical protein GCM10008943_33330 [Paenochrobactrum glaciei]|uniref:Uncharacterized protein n=1 Tax=Paenochrobactrum glaciei TaxID=486407 RepID=A0ABN1GPB6_9HYPH